MKKALSKKILKYTVIFEPAEEGGYVVSVPALPGCVSQGETFEEAAEMIKDAMKGYLEVLKEGFGKRNYQTSRFFRRGISKT